MPFLNKNKSLSKKVPKDYKASSTKKKNNKTLIQKLTPKTKKAQLLAFILMFGLIGGGYYVYSTFAASYSFARDARNQMTGGNLRCPTGGDCRRNINQLTGTNRVSTLVSRAELNKTRTVCTTVVVNQQTYGNIYLRQEHNGGYRELDRRSSNRYRAGERVQLCGSPIKADSKIYVEIFFGESESRDISGLSIGVFSIYGLR